MYREQTFVERCFCHDAAVAPSRCCGRARCALHLKETLCDRCDKAVSREIATGAERRWIGSTVLGTAFAVAMLLAHNVSLVLLGIPLAVLAWIGAGRHARRRTIRQLGPVMSAFKGELPEPPREPPGYPPTRNDPPRTIPWGI